MSNTVEQEKFINRLEQEGLEVVEEDGYYTVEDVEGHVITIEFKDDTVLVMDNEATETAYNVNQVYLAFYAVMDALDYEFDE